MSDPFTSEIRLFPYAGQRLIPPDWAVCDGSLLPVSQHYTLYSLLGDRYGGEGQIKFAIPDLQGRAPMQYGDGPGLSKHTIGETGGHDKFILNEKQLPKHRHETKVVHANADQADPALAYLGFDDAADIKPYELYSKGNFVAMNNQILKSSGRGEGHENRQPYIALVFCIALTGNYPPHP